jgi:teichuronic acid biosynthesis glycosyltransferase TuaC
VRALIVTNMYPSAEHPALGSFVRDQVEALRRLDGVEIDVFQFTPGGGNPVTYARAAAALRRRYGGQRFDVVHAHYGLSIVPSRAIAAHARAVTLHGTDLVHWRTRRITLATLRLVDLVATVSEPLASEIPAWSYRGRRAVLPCGVALERFRPIPREHARRALGLDPDGRYLLFAADPGRAEKRHDRAVSVAGEIPLLTLTEVEPAQVPLWVNAANAVLVPSDREGFGLATLEALACEVPVLATPVGIAPQAMAGIEGSYCGPFDTGRWRQALAPHLQSADPRLTGGRARAEQFSSDRMAAKVLSEWKALVRDS